MGWGRWGPRDSDGRNIVSEATVTIKSTGAGPVTCSKRGLPVASLSPYSLQTVGIQLLQHVLVTQSGVVKQKKWLVCSHSLLIRHQQTHGISPHLPLHTTHLLRKTYVKTDAKTTPTTVNIMPTTVPTVTSHTVIPSC